MQNDWAYNEFCRVSVWDARCRNTLLQAAQQLAEAGEVSFSRALGSRRKAVSHILHHAQTSAEDLLDGHVRASALRAQSVSRVLIASDTTTMDFTSQRGVEGLGPISDKVYPRGFFVHSALALTSEGVPLGLLHQQSFVRDPEEGRQAQQRRKRPFADKESYKWVQVLRGVEAALPTSVPALLIQDREADIFAFFAATRREGLDLLIRATHPRRIEVTQEGGPPTLQEAVAGAPVVGSKTVLVRARPDREAREAHLTLRQISVWVRSPRNGADPPAAPVWVQVVRASEETPPEGVAEPIEWVLLTTLPLATPEAAAQWVEDYAKRWLIERFHFVLKSGCRFERLQLDTFALLQKALSLYSVVAWRLLQVTYLARCAPQTPASEVLSGVEKHVLERALGKPVQTVAEAVQAVAKIGGFARVPSAPDPGVKSLWIGLRKLQDMVAGFLLFQASPGST